MATLAETASCFPHQSRGRALTRCECADLPFEEVARRIRDEGLSLAELGRHTGCAQTCTACIPDLEEFLAHHRR